MMRISLHKNGIAILGLLLAVGMCLPAQAYEPKAITLKFDPEQGLETRYMFQLAMTGVYVSPGLMDQMVFGEYMIGSVYKDTVVEAQYELNRHAVQYFSYDALATNLAGTDREDPRFGGSTWPALPGVGDGGGGGGGGGIPQFIPGLGLPGGDPEPMQGGDGGGPGDRDPGEGNRAGMQLRTPINLDAIKISNLDYITDQHGKVLDIGGLEQLRKLSKNRLITRTGDENRYYIDINISHLFEWSHLLWVPGTDYDVYKEDMWFHTQPLHVPGLPYENPIMTKFMYKILDFRTVGERKVAVIEMNGLAEWNMEWNDRNSDELTEFKSWGSMGIAAQYWFDYEKGEIFGITRPGFYDWQYRRGYQGQPVVFNTGVFQMTNPGLIVTMEFFYNTNITDVSGKPRLVQVEPEEQRRYLVLNLICQLEAE